MFGFVKHFMNEECVEEESLFRFSLTLAESKLGAGFIEEGPDSWRLCLPLCFWKLQEPQVSLQSESKVLSWDNMLLRGL